MFFWNRNMQILCFHNCIDILQIFWIFQSAIRKQFLCGWCSWKTCKSSYRAEERFQLFRSTLCFKRGSGISNTRRFLPLQSDRNVWNAKIQSFEVCAVCLWTFHSRLPTSRPEERREGVGCPCWVSWVWKVYFGKCVPGIKFCCTKRKQAPTQNQFRMIHSLPHHIINMSIEAISGYGHLRIKSFLFLIDFTMFSLSKDILLK